MLLQMQVWAFMLLQEAGAPGWDFRHLWEQMGTLAKCVVVVMFLMSAWSIGVMIDRLMAYSAARKQSRQFAPAVAGALREGKLDEAIKIADRFNKSHLAKVVVAGLQEFKAHQMSADIPGEDIEASRRALERAEAIVHAELKRGVSSLATIGSTAPFVGLFGTVVGIMNAFKSISTSKSSTRRRHPRISVSASAPRTAVRDLLRCTFCRRCGSETRGPGGPTRAPNP